MHDTHQVDEAEAEQQDEHGREVAEGDALYGIGGQSRGVQAVTQRETTGNHPDDRPVLAKDELLTVKPANDFSKGKLDKVVVGTEEITPDANTGEAAKTGIAPDTEVKLKAKKGYIIEEVEAKKPQKPLI